MGLDELRGHIDAIDDEILRLLEARASVMEEVAVAKRESNIATYDPEREQEILDRLAAKGAGRFPKEAVRAVYREVMSACLALQDPVKVAFFGPAGTFTHAAARALFGLAASYSESPTIDGVFDAVKKGQARFGVVPAENSTEGSVTRTLDALIEGPVLIRRELVLPINQCLIGHPTGLSEIERVYSHPQAFAQCRAWLAKNLSSAQLVQTPSTAAAAREAEADAKSAAIGAKVAAEIYSLRVIREEVQDEEHNATRFFMLSLEDAPRSGDDKTSLVFSVKEGRGALKRVLEVFDQEGVNLTRIESRPSRQRAWDYVFLVDLEGHREDPPVVKAMARIAQKCPLVRHLGSYPVYRDPR